MRVDESPGEIVSLARTVSLTAHAWMSRPHDKQELRNLYKKRIRPLLLSSVRRLDTLRLFATNACYRDGVFVSMSPAVARALETMVSVVVDIARSTRGSDQRDTMKEIVELSRRLEDDYGDVLTSLRRPLLASCADAQQTEMDVRSMRMLLIDSMHLLMEQAHPMSTMYADARTLWRELRRVAPSAPRFQEMAQRVIGHAFAEKYTPLGRDD